ncbi:head-tail connector protein [Devosia neptuniae]|uniref:Head-tail connector protein n=1 Tax=Devosia neptuniae TaxID=191302 RepID=A0ABY6CIS2_9HYPH|nr:head-tail connector protein [Devosia neptuniae]UXN70901.1 head-tail connector protein [Devosia neptuniae]
MPLLELPLVKKHLRVSFDDEDAEIAIYLAAAESLVIETLDRPVLPADNALPEEGDDDYDETAIIVNSAIKAAILLVTGHLYENREASTDQKLEELPISVKHLIAPWRVWRKFEEDETDCKDRFIWS